MLQKIVTWDFVVDRLKIWPENKALNPLTIYHDNSIGYYVHTTIY